VKQCRADKWPGGLGGSPRPLPGVSPTLGRRLGGASVGIRHRKRREGRAPFTGHHAAAHRPQRNADMTEPPAPGWEDSICWRPPPGR
jgi:hypothetical protein